MRNLMGKIALTTGSALIAGGLLVIAYLSAGTFILAGILSAVFLIGEKIDVVQYVFAPIAFSAAIIFAAASWALTALGVGTWWVWKKSRVTSRLRLTRGRAKFQFVPLLVTPGLLLANGANAPIYAPIAALRSLGERSPGAWVMIDLVAFVPPIALLLRQILLAVLNFVLIVPCLFFGLIFPLAAGAVSARHHRDLPQPRNRKHRDRGRHRAPRPAIFGAANRA